MDFKKLTIKSASEGLRKKKFSSVELTEAILDEIERRDGEIKAFLSVDREGALEAAKDADRLLAKEENLSPLVGVPLAVKDAILVKDLVSTSASGILENYKATYDATVIKKIKEIGAVILGKTNMDEFAMGSSTENSAFFPTRNPHDLKKVPGGSSGGSAAAVAADETIWALGSDTGGSIRQPSSFCGIAGFKPSYGAVSRFGLMAMASSFDQIGPLGKTVEDCFTAFNAIRGKDSFDSTSFDVGLDLGDQLAVKNMKIGMPKEYFAQGLDPRIEMLVKQAIEKLQDQGAQIKEISLPHSQFALACYYLILSSEISANLARYDGIKYGVCRSGENLLDVYLNSRKDGLGDEVRRRIMLGTYALSAGYYDAYYKKAQQIRTLIRKDFEEAFKQVDVLMCPVSPILPFGFGEKTSDPIQMYLCDIYTVIANLAGVPALSMPCGKVGNLPVGLQIIGPQKGDSTVLQMGSALERLLK
ncbi:MAG: Asp-tRNA(Asn)/Glu-tRNA(Gln) amidotransferase subunit GatA [Candidatus Portnoybacteria bacterium]|nr:Asp-tRNA(Asn)/Glu-tRNA(Gln) amidotransferase subunit GatA [Candidatus Portnoybacteria bacterium]